MKKCSYRQMARDEQKAVDKMVQEANSGKLPYSKSIDLLEKAKLKKLDVDDLINKDQMGLAPGSK